MSVIVTGFSRARLFLGGDRGFLGDHWLSLVPGIAEPKTGMFSVSSKVYYERYEQTAAQGADEVPR
jgi:hypothetical protein